MVRQRALDTSFRRQKVNNFHMAPQRLSRLQKRILAWIEAEYVRTKGSVSSNQELVKALSDIDKTSISRTLKTLEAKGLIFVGRTPGGKAEFVNLTRKS